MVLFLIQNFVFKLGDNFSEVHVCGGQMCWSFQPVLDCSISSPQLVFFLYFLPL